MADFEKVVNIIFQGDDQSEKAFRSVASNVADLESIGTAVAAPFAKIADGILIADAALAAFVAGGMALAIREAGRFGDAFAEISTLIEAPAENLADFRSEIVEYAKESSASIGDINAAIYTAISAGVDYSQALNVLSNAEKLSIAGKADLEATTRLLASSLNAYGESTEEATRYSDVFFQTVKLGQTTLPELADGLSQVTGIAAGAGVPIETLMASIAALTATGAPTSQAITQIRSAIAAIVKPSSEAATLAESLGIQFNATALKTKGFEGVLKDVYTATGGNNEQLAILFGSVEALNAVQVLGADRAGKFAAALLDMAQAAGSTQKAFETMANNFSLINQNMLNNLQAVLIEVGTKLLPGYFDAASGIKEIVQAISAGVQAGAFDELFKAFDGFAASAKDFLFEVARALPDALALIDFSGLISAIRGLGGIFADLFGEIDLTDADDLAGALQGIVDAFEALVNISSGMAEAFRPYVEAVAAAIQGTADLDAETQKAFGELIGNAKMVMEAGAWIAGAFFIMGKAGSDFRNVFDLIVGTARVFVNVVQVAFDQLAGMVTEAVREILDFAANAADFIGAEEIAASLRKTVSEIEGIQEGIFQNQAEQFEDLIDGYNQAIGVFSSETGEAKKAIVDLNREIEKSPQILSTAAENIAAWQVDPILQKHLVLQVEPDAGAKVQAQVSNVIADVEAIKVAELKPQIEKESAKKFDEQLALMKIEAETVQNAVEWEAKVNIAQVEAAARVAEAAFGSINAAVESTGETISNLWGALGSGDLSLRQKLMLEDDIREEATLRKKAFEQQQAYTSAAMANMQKLQERMDRGDALYSIECEGIYPELEMLLWAVVERLQIRANASGSAFLLGIDPSLA